MTCNSLRTHTVSHRITGQNRDSGTPLRNNTSTQGGYGFDASLQKTRQWPVIVSGRIQWVTDSSDYVYNPLLLLQWVDIISEQHHWRRSVVPKLSADDLTMICHRLRTQAVVNRFIGQNRNSDLQWCQLYTRIAELDASLKMTRQWPVIVSGRIQWVTDSPDYVYNSSQVLKYCFLRQWTVIWTALPSTDWWHSS